MPSKLPWSKSNRSHSSVDSSSGHPSPVPSAPIVSNEASAQRYPSSEGPPQPPQNQQPPVQQIPPGVSQAQYRQQFPSRSTSHRHSAHLSLDQPPSYPTSPNPNNPQAQPGFEQPRRGSYQPQSNYQQQEPKKQSFRSRIAANLIGGHKDEDPSRQASKNGLGRKVSLRKGDGRSPDGYQSPGNDRIQGPQWAQRQGSSPHLPTSNEQDEDNLDPFLQQEDHNTPQVPPKDSPYQQSQPQFAPNNHQEPFNRPPLARVTTEGSYHTQGGVDHYSPEQHQGLQQQQQLQQNQPPQQQQYQSYSPPQQQQPQNPHEYQAFHPQAAPSPHLSNTQLHPQDIAQQQQNYYPYQQQQHQPQSQQQSPQDLQQQQQIHYPQQQQFQPSPQPQQGQDFQQQLARPSSQHQPELQHPQATHQVPQILQQGQQLNTQHLQPIRPPSSQQNLAPPSPLQPLQPPPYQAYDSQQSQPPQGVEGQAQNKTPPQQEQEDMAPSANQPRNTLRKVNDTGPPPPGAPSRESSLLQQPQAQGQTQGQPPVSPGIPTFGANVVPTASQGQPYRGEKQGPPGQSGAEMGRATPPPRTASDMTDEEVHNLMKEHDILREKYQKVKRYFFEQQTQVHQLQNTLAHQRLSLSRTSWDDSEYATRFNRLDGLIAQLSFAIRKDWKAIPPWLHTVVNKNAVETGKQEMTAVGRAFISWWLVENVFDKYFHPDLEPGLSTQLKLIQLNIRRFSPTCQTTEDEDALVAKVVNWRLATLEGLGDMLKAAQSSTNRQTLTESLNEKLIGSLQMFLNDPAPPDLAGGVPMIIELAVNVAQHLPLESREVHIEYFLPGHGLMPDFMKMESGIPALTNPIVDHQDDADRASLRSVASELKESTNSAPEQEQQQIPTSQAPSKDIGDKKRGMFGFGSSKKPAQPAQLGKRESSLGQGGSQQSLTQLPPGSSSGPKEDTPPPRVRMAVGVAVQIRGKSILIKAPVYST